VSDILKPGAGILFMKVGTHANEGLEDIVRRKREEIDKAGYALWGYGGNTCHPLTMVQPFASAADAAGAPIHLCMQPMESNHFAVTARATELSIDGFSWERVPPAINVIGSRFALAIEQLHTEEFELPLSHTKVAIGNQTGRRGDRYIKGRVDKACLEYLGEADPEPEADEEEKVIEIGLVAELRKPYAVFVRNEADE
jgi:hypothetical protein